MLKQKLEASKKETLSVNEEKDNLKLQLSKLSSDEMQRNSVFQNFQETQSNFTKQLADAQAKEETLLSTISELRSKYAALEAKQEELILEIPSATQPLLRQIDALQSSIKLKTASWQSLESSLNKKIEELTSALKLANESNEELFSAEKSKCAKLEFELENANKKIREFKREIQSKSVSLLVFFKNLLRI